jgi:hypothetical protein
MAKYGDHYTERYDGASLQTDEDVKSYIEEYDVTFFEFVEECRSSAANVPIFENLIKSSWEVNSAGGKVSYIDEVGDETVLASDGESGWFSVPGYLGLFEQAVEEFYRCIDSKRYGDFLSCITNGVASIEGYLGHKVKSFNK